MSSPSNIPTPNTRELLELANRGDSRAREKLFEKAYPNLIQAARFRLGGALRNRMDSLDLAQMVYIEALKDLPRYRYRGKGSFHRWLLSILENKIRNRIAFFRAQRRDMGRDVALNSSRELLKQTRSPLQRLLFKENRERLERAMDRLSSDHREVIINRYYLMLSWREIGDVMDRSEEASQMLCKRALVKLRELFEREA